MSCESSMLPDDELATFKINCVEDLLALESRPRTTRNKTQLTFTGQKNLDFDKPRILRNFSPIRIRSPNNSNGAVSPIHQADKEISPQNYNFSRLLTVNITKVSSSSHLDLKNSGGSSPHGKLNRSRTTITSPFTFHSFAPKIVKEPDLSKISNPSLSEENTSSSRDSLSDGSINVHFLEILGREKCRSRSKVTNPLRDSTPNLEELKTEMRNIRERIRNFEEEVVHKRHQMRRNSKIPPRRNSFVQSKKNKSDDKMKQPKIKLNFQANYKSDDDNKAYLSPFSSLDSPFKKAAQQAAKSLAKPKSYTTNHSRNESEANPRTPISNISKQMNINRLNSPKSELVSPKFPLTEPAKSIKTVVRKKLNIGYRPVQTSHSRFRILKNARSPKSK